MKRTLHIHQLLGLVILALLHVQCTSQTMSHKHTNHLIHESSPYLLQHAHNPVDWYPWGEDALNKAKAENKLIIVSVGYAACHWCHVMERESFEDSTVAAVMNQHFVCIKVDREERPDIDQIYMDAVMLMTQSGGWPLNCIALPDGRPIWGGTYFPKDRWMDALSQLADFYQNNPAKAEEYAENLTQGIRSLDEVLPDPNPQPFSTAEVDSMLAGWRPYFDLEEGGQKRAPKFPMPNNWQFLMQVHHHTSEPMLDSMVEVTLRKMAWGGIYDHLGGGFARYSTDKLWKVPHFEKMLYDNGQLVSLYSDAYIRHPDDLYRRTVYETLEWVEREMTSAEGGFYSSLDADSEGEEGKFYIWNYEEIKAALGADTDWFCDYYQVTPGGNWEHGNSVLIRHTHASAFAKAHGWEPAAFLEKLNVAKQKLMAVRDKRVRPGLDDKILTSWNAIMLKGYVDAYKAFGEPAFLHIARRNADFLLEKMRNGDGLFRNYKDGKASINAFHDDYALLAEALISLYQVTMEDKWLKEADRLVQYVLVHFDDPANGLFFYTSDLDPALIARKFEVPDNVIPASNSVMGNVLFDLGLLLEKQAYTDRSQRMLVNVRKKMNSYASGYSNWGILLLKFLYPHYEVVVAGPDAEKLSKELSRHYLPNALLVAATEEKSGQLPLLQDRFQAGTTRIFVCQNKACKLPVTAVADALAQMGR